VFTGLIRDLGTVESVERDVAGARLQVATGLAGELEDGASIAVDGVCLTVSGLSARAFSAEVMNATLKVSSLGDLKPGARVNLEPALRAADRLGGHIVQGHVDGVGEVIAAEADGFARRLTVAVPAGLRRYLIEHGSVAISGVSLTIAELTGEAAVVSLIPETAKRTNLVALQTGHRVNLEVDPIARYAERLLRGFNEGGSDDDDRPAQRQQDD
jgi:riboflavin synthase